MGRGLAFGNRGFLSFASLNGLPAGSSHSAAAFRRRDEPI